MEIYCAYFATRNQKIVKHILCDCETLDRKKALLDNHRLIHEPIEDTYLTFSVIGTKVTK